MKNSHIKKGDRFICKKNYFQGSTIMLFRKGDIYTSHSDYCLTDNLDTKRAGWNADVFDQHFERMPKPTFIVMVIGFLKICICLIYAPIYLTGLAIYYLSKVITSIAYLMMLKTKSAKDQYNRFWAVYSSLGDLF